MDKELSGLTQYLSPVGAWALAFGSAVGWGAFVMPGTTFLPVAGPLGTAIGMIIGAVLMLFIGVNYHFMMNRYPDSGGTFDYAKETYGYDHGFLSAWFLSLTYIAILWANLTALALICCNLFGHLLQFGFHYRLAGYDIYMGEVLLQLGILWVLALICMFARRVSIIVQIVMAVLLLLGVSVCFVLVVKSGNLDATDFMPAFAKENKCFFQIFSIVSFTPWAFVGFESISHSSSEFNFPVKRAFLIMAVAVVSGVFAYVVLTFVASSVQPEKFSGWPAYIASLGKLSGTQRMPVFFALEKSRGVTGLVVLGVAVVGAIITGIIGNTIAASRLLYAMGKDSILPKWFSGVGKNNAPRNAILFIALISIVIPFLGRTAIGWIVDVTTIGATFAYGYTSASAYRIARTERNKRIKVTGVIGCIMAMLFSLFLLVPNFWQMSVLSAESYLILAFWSLIGFLFFRIVFKRDTEQRFGKTTVVWVALLFLIFFTSLLWMRQATNSNTQKVVTDINSFYTGEMKLYGIEENAMRNRVEAKFLQSKLSLVQKTIMNNSVIQMGLIAIALAVMFNIYSIIRAREKKMEREKFAAEESNKAKTVFFSNMSHDIRTPMNAIIGYIHLAKREGIDMEEIKDYLAKIEGSSQHLLALINDVLEMSRIESGKMDLEESPNDLRKMMEEVRDMFATQMVSKGIVYTVNYSQVSQPLVHCDKNRLNRVLLNLVSNAYKFTSDGGTVAVSLTQLSDDTAAAFATYELRVKDNGIGMSPEFAAKVFEAFERERTSTVSGIQGTGLGMAITKSIIDLMGGDIRVQTEQGVGTEFIITLPFRLQAGLENNFSEIMEKDALPDQVAKTVDFTKMRLLLVDDVDVNREIATMILTDMGFEVETAENGKVAVEKVSAASPGYYNVVLMDIQMPVMDGYEATRTIRSLEDKSKADVPVVAMTANAFAEDVQKAKDAGMNAHVAKPIDVDNLTKTLTEILA
ncbi:MAG: amino acid permease [Treponema sp.]|nr:amino acid permease [Treponema sp.]